MEPEGSTPYSQEPATCPCLEPDRSSLCPQPVSQRSILILSSHLRLGLPSGSFPQVSPLKPGMHLSSFPYVLHVLPLSVFLTWSSNDTCWGVQSIKLTQGIFSETVIRWSPSKAIVYKELTSGRAFFGCYNKEFGSVRSFTLAFKWSVK